MFVPNIAGGYVSANYFIQNPIFPGRKGLFTGLTFFALIFFAA